MWCVGVGVGIVASPTWLGFFAGLGGGFVVRHFYIKQLAQAEKAAQQQRISVLVVRLLALVARADGSISATKMRLIRASLLHAADDNTLVGALVRGTKIGAFPIPLLAAELSKLADISTRTRLYAAAFRVALAQGRPSTASQAALAQLAATLDLSATAKASVEQAFGVHGGSAAGSHLPDARAILGVALDATPAQIKTAYKKLIRQFHPDKLRGEGKSEAEIRSAEEKMAQINAAYAELSEEVPV